VCVQGGAHLIGITTAAHGIEYAKQALWRTRLRGMHDKVFLDE
jgi:hypothetical protein